MDPMMKWLLIGVGGVLVIASTIGFILRLTVKTIAGKRTVANLNARIKAWWVMVAVFALALWFDAAGACILFAIISFLALREMLTLAPTRRADHHTMFWTFFVMIPIQYYLVYIRWIAMVEIFIPVYCFIFLAIRSALTGDYKNYLERMAKMQWALFICVYCISHAPALLMLELPTRPSWGPLMWLVIVVQMSDVLQYCWGKMCGKHKVAPHISPNKTWEGLIGGVLTATGLGVAISALTPFRWGEAAIIAFVVAMLGFFGGIVMSAIKRDAGIKDYGQLIEGHGGMMDRIDSLTFAAPIFFHIVGYWFTVR